MARHQFGYINYTDDVGTVWSVRMRDDVAGAIAATWTVDPANPIWDKGNRNVRHRWFSTGGPAGQRIRVVCPVTSSPYYVDGPVSITWTDGQTYSSRGKVGEKRYLLKIPR